MQCVLHRWNVLRAAQHCERARISASYVNNYSGLRCFSYTFLNASEAKASASRRTDKPRTTRAQGPPRPRKPSQNASSPRIKGSTRKRSTAEADTEEEAVAKASDEWKAQKRALEKKLDGEAWNPRKRLSPDTIDGIRSLHASDPGRYTTPVLAEHFEVTPEAIRRILKSKWRPSAEEAEDRRARWERRGQKIWADLAEMGVKPPKPWRVQGIGRGETGERLWKRGGVPLHEEDAGGYRGQSGPGTTVKRGVVAKKASDEVEIKPPTVTLSDRML